MTALRLLSMMTIVFITTSASALAQSNRNNLSNPSSKNISQRSAFCKSFMRANTGLWQLSLSTRQQRIQRPYDNTIVRLIALARLRAAYEMDMESLRFFLHAKNAHLLEMAKLAQEKRESQKQAEALYNQMRKEDTAYVLDGENGGIRWPIILSDGAQFDEERQTIDNLFRQKPHYAITLSLREHHQIVTAVKAIDRKLSKIITAVPTHSYCEAKSFLKDLRIQARLLVPSPAAQMAAGKAPAGNQVTFHAPVAAGRD
jgi:hypothetical protein